MEPRLLGRKEPLPWTNSTLLGSTDDVADLRQRPGKDIVVLGSGELVVLLMRRNLVDGYILLIHPLVLGTGRRPFSEGISPANLRLASIRTSTTGVVIATYEARSVSRPSTCSTSSSPRGFPHGTSRSAAYANNLACDCGVRCGTEKNDHRDHVFR